MLALIKDSVEQCDAYDIPAIEVTSNLKVAFPNQRRSTLDTLDKVHEKIGRGVYKLVFTTPERVKRDDFAEVLKTMHK